MSENVRVVVRCRPFSKKELENKYNSCVKMDSKAASIIIQNGSSADQKNFTFDAVFDGDSTQAEVYNSTARGIVNAALDGFNGTVFCYGSGKTFSMQGIPKDSELAGIIPRTFYHIFDHITQTQSPNKKFLVRVSYLEIYNEDIKDLLTKAPKNSKGGLELKEHPETGVYVKDLSAFVVKNVQEMDKLMETGNKCRSVGATLMNETSSRSHSIFTITIESSERRDDGEEHIVVGKLNLVDLAGSERQSKTGATGDRLKEATKINLSLSALGNCISALVDGRSSHIPYRDSKLTRLLQDSLGGNAKTLMIATLSPAIFNYEESLSTLRYANRAKCIKNKPKINEDPKDAMLREYQEEIMKLKAALEAKQLGEVQIVTKVLKKYVTKKVQKVVPKKDGATRVAPSSSEDVDEEYVLSASGKQLSLDDLQKQLEEEKNALLASNDILAEEKMKIAMELEARSAELEKEKQEYEKMNAQLLAIESQLIAGGTTIVDKINQQENDIAKTQLELQEKAIRERQLKEQLELKMEQQIQMEEHYASLQEEVDIKTKKLKKLWSKIESVKSEITDLQDEFRNERDDLLDTIRLLNREIALKDTIIDNFIPAEEKHKMASRAIFNEDMDEWILQKITDIKLSPETLKRPIITPKFKRPVCQFAREIMMTSEAPIRYLPENILRLSIDLPDRTTVPIDSFQNFYEPLQFPCKILEKIYQDMDDGIEFTPIQDDKPISISKTSYPTLISVKPKGRY